MEKLVFVYNTDSGILNGISGYTRRMFSPEKHPCNLAKVSHGPLGMTSSWRRFVRKLDAKSEFLNKDLFLAKYPKAFIKNYPKRISYPAVLVSGRDSLSVLITAEELNKVANAEELMELVSGKLLAKK